MRARANPTWELDPYSLPRTIEPVQAGQVRDALFQLGGAKASGSDQPVTVSFAFISGGSHLILPELLRMRQDPYRTWDEVDMLDGAHSLLYAQLGPSEARKLEMSGYVDLVGELELRPPGIVTKIDAWRPIYPPEGEGAPLDDDHRQSSALENLIMLLASEQACTRTAKVRWIYHEEIDLHYAITNYLIDPEEIEGYSQEYGDDWFGFWLETVDDDVMQTRDEDAGVAEDYV